MKRKRKYSGPGFVPLMRTHDVIELIETAPLAYVLASVIALRANFRTLANVKGYGPGEALIGDCRRYGLSQQQYRTAKLKLEKWKFAAFRATTKGTIARLTDRRLFDVLRKPTNDQGIRQPTDG